MYPYYQPYGHSKNLTKPKDPRDSQRGPLTIRNPFTQEHKQWMEK